jgi:hypothetical protein
MKMRFYLGLILVLLNFTNISAANYLQEFDAISSKVNKKAFIQNKETRVLLSKLEKIADTHPELMPQYLYWESVANYAQGKSDLDINSKINSKLRIFDGKQFPFENALLLHALALNNAITGNYTDSFTNSLKALIIYKKLGNQLFIARINQLLGIICFRTRNYEMSRQFSKQSLNKALPKAEYYKSEINLYSSQAFDNQGRKIAISALEKLIPIVEKTNDLSLLAVLYLNIGCCYSLENKENLLIIYFNKALNIGNQIDNKSFTTSLLINLGSYALGNRNFVEAESDLDRAEQLSLETGDAEQLSLVYQIKSLIFEKKGNTKEAFTYLKKYNEQKEKILNNSKTIDSYQTYLSTFMASAENEVMISKQKTLLENRKFLITLISSIFILLLGVAGIVILYQKRKQQTIIRESEKAKLQKQLLYEKAMQQLQEEKHREILDAKKREITSYSLMLSNKNNVLEEVLQKAGQIHDANEKEIIYDNIVEVVKNNLNTEAERHKFMHHFNEVHPDFFNKLKSVCKDLTENNLRMCAYFKMGMSTKQVATILNISGETVKNGRYRLKKKLMLKEEDNLDDFVRNI